MAKRKCVRYKRTRAGRRCAKFSGTSGTSGLAGRTRRCVSYKTAKGGVKRCRRFAKPGGPPSRKAQRRAGIKTRARKCIRFKRTPAGRRCAKFR